MKIAVFSDVHGNLSGLEAVLAEIDHHNPDRTVFAGDLCLMGPRPAECLTLVKKRAVEAIYGNTDDWVLGRQLPPHHLQATADWTKNQLDAASLTWLDALPFQIRITPPGVTGKDLLIVHANPHDVNQIIFPPIDRQLALYGKIRQPDVDLDPLLAGLNASVLAFGHLHIPDIRRYRGVDLVNISSVSLPGDDDPRAKFCVFTWANDQWHIRHHKVSFDLEAEIEALKRNAIPGLDEAMRTLETRRYIPQRV